MNELGELDKKSLEKHVIELTGTSEKIKENKKEIKALSKELESSVDAWNATGDSLLQAQMAYDSNEATIANYEAALGHLKDKNYEAVEAIYTDTTKFIGDTDKETYDNYQKRIDAQKQYLDRLDQEQKKYTDEQYKTLKSKGELQLKELQDQQSKYATTTDQGLKKSNSIWNTALSNQISAIMGKKVEFKNQGNGLVQMYVDGVKKGEPLSKEAAKKLAKDTVSKITEQKGGAKTAGEDLIDGVSSGIQNQNKQSVAFGAIAGFGNSLLATLKRSLKEKSPSKATKEMGEYLLEGLMIGFEGEEKSVLREVGSFGNTVLTTLQDELKDSVSIGLDPNINASAIGNYSQDNKDNMVEAFKQALEEMKVELNGEEVGTFVEKTVARAIYS